jgi:ribonuclease HII
MMMQFFCCWDSTGRNSFMQDELPKISGLLAGADEAGRGPLVGNVVAAAVILDQNNPIEGLADSKKLTARRRESLATEIMQKARAWAVVSVSPEDIDRINILQASLLAMKQAVEKLSVAPDHVFIDGNRCPEMTCPATAIVKGDARVAEISAASILAKVTRDEQMQALHNIFPQYGFDKHKGYPTKAHMAALAEHGPCPEHRRSYAPVRKYLAET